MFHYISEGGFTYLVMADDAAGRYADLIFQSVTHSSNQVMLLRRMPFTFLAELQQKFTAYPAASSSSMSDTPAHSLQGSFGPVIAQLVTQYNTNPPTDELTRAQTELAQVKDIMVQNVEQILSRGERIELLVDKTDTMASQATAFRRGARQVRRSMWWKNTRILALSIVVGLVRLLINVQTRLARGLSCF